MEKSLEKSLESSIQLQLGDIIELNAPTNTLLNDKTYIIKYIDETKIEILNEDGPLVLHLRENGQLYEESIQSISILNRADSPSYAVQNNLLPDTWISVYFSGSLR